MMKEQKTKETIIKNIREALLERNTVETVEDPVGAVPPDDFDRPVAFAKRYIGLGGTLDYSSNESEIKQYIERIRTQCGNAVIGCSNENLTAFVSHLGVTDVFAAKPEKRYTLGILLCECLLADSGSIVFSDKLGYGTVFPTLPRDTVVLAFTSQVVDNWNEATVRIRENNKTYPRELTLLPPQNSKQIHLLLVEDE